MRTFLVAIVSIFSVQAYAQGNSSGDIIGALDNQGTGQYTVTASDPSTGRSRTTNVGTDGNFRFSQLPVGQYDLTVMRDGTLVAQDAFAVTLNGNTIAEFALADQTIDEITVVASRIVGDTYSTDSGLVMGKSEIDIMPVGRNLTSISMLAPGVVLGDAQFGLNGGPGFASFGGSSIAENSCYINGLEVTNTRQGLGCGAVPFEFYDQFQVKTGGYSAQYGRTTGGVLNAVTKSGTNEWEFGVGVAVEPGSFYEDGRVSRGGGGFGSGGGTTGGAGGPGTGVVFRNTTQNENSLTEYWITAGGPIIEDKLFIYAIVNPRDQSQDFAWQTSTRQQYVADDEYRRIDRSGGDNLFWGAKIDWDINDYHRISAWGYSNRNDGTDVHYNFDAETGVIGTTPTQTRIRQRGGEASSISYTGTFFDDITVSAMFGTIETEYTNDPDDTVSCPSVSDQRPVPSIVGCGPGGTFGSNFDENDQFRLDVEWAIGDHLVRAGIDQQDRGSTRLSQPIGGHNYTYSQLAPGGVIQGIGSTVYTNTTGAPVDYVFDRIFTNAGLGGGFDSELTAYYIEDEWQLNDNIVLYLGARQDSLTNSGTGGTVFADFDQEWAPRLGMSWDPVGDGQNKVYGTWGRYYLPVANNTNFRVASGVSDTSSYFTFTGSDPTTGAPTGTVPISANNVVLNSSPNPPTQDQFQAAEADPFFKEEYIIGYERSLNENNRLSARFVNREVGTTLDDYCGPLANPGFCTLINPGSGGSWSQTAGGPLTFYSAADIGIPKGVNEYNAVQLEWNHQAERVNYNFVYTWSQSIGNFEGAVKSDNVQADAGITTDFDFPALQDGSQGYLPNDRRHVLKFYGSYQVTDSLTAGWNASLASGRPVSAIGAGYPSNDPALFGAYGGTYFLFTNNCNEGGAVISCANTALDLTDPVQAQQFVDSKIYQSSPRGSVGRTPWLTTLDASLTYDFAVSDVDMTANLQIFNVLNTQEITAINENAEGRNSEGVANQFYGTAYGWQAPRHIRISLQARF